jgi:HNH endonuclease
LAKGYQRPATPVAVERQLRQEAGFGCARCGHPYIEYHHIIPYAEEQHFRSEDMVALCGNCHPAVSKLGRDVQYSFKSEPYNVKRGLFKGALEYDKKDLVFKVGGCWYENVTTIIQFCNTPIISCKLADGQTHVSLNLFDDVGNLRLAVTDNNVVFRVDDLWDFEYAHNVAVARYAPRDIALRLDFRGAESIIQGKIWLGNQQIRLGADNSTLPGGNTFLGGRFRNARVGIQIGAPSKPTKST